MTILVRTDLASFAPSKERCGHTRYHRSTAQAFERCESTKATRRTEVTKRQSDCRLPRLQPSAALKNEWPPTICWNELQDIVGDLLDHQFGRQWVEDQQKSESHNGGYQYTPPMARGAFLPTGRHNACEHHCDGKQGHSIGLPSKDAEAKTSHLICMEKIGNPK